MFSAIAHKIVDFTLQSCRKTRPAYPQSRQVAMPFRKTHCRVRVSRRENVALTLDSKHIFLPKSATWTSLPDETREPVSEFFGGIKLRSDAKRPLSRIWRSVSGEIPDMAN